LSAAVERALVKLGITSLFPGPDLLDLYIILTAKSMRLSFYR
jgi:hypothetical protein